MMAGLKRKRGFFGLVGPMQLAMGEEGAERQLQDFEQDVDDSLRDLENRLEKSGEEINSELASIQTSITNVQSASSTTSIDVSQIQAEIDDINGRLSPIIIRGYLTPSTAYSQFAVTSQFITYAEGAIGAGGGYINIGEDGLYQINATFTAQNSGGSNPRYVIWEIAGEPNGGGFSILARVNSARFSTTNTQEVACSASTVHRFTNGDRIWFRPGSTGTTTTAANPDNLIFSVVRVSE